MVLVNLTRAWFDALPSPSLMQALGTLCALFGSWHSWFNGALRFIMQVLVLGLQPTLSKHSSGSHGHTTAFMSSRTNPEPPDLINTKKNFLKMDKWTNKGFFSGFFITNMNFCKHSGAKLWPHFLWIFQYFEVFSSM